jgi:acyl-CoA reductase-like NAD-dependent aldehyde dehydrogenase
MAGMDTPPPYLHEYPYLMYGTREFCARNLAISMAAGNATIWKPSPSTPLCSIAVTKIVSGVLEKNDIPGAVAGLVTGGKDVGEAIVQSQEVDMGE